MHSSSKFILPRPFIVTSSCSPAAGVSYGDFAPVNILPDGRSLTGLLDFEATRIADPLFDVAWWAWAVSFGGQSALDRGWGPFLEGAEIDARQPLLDRRVLVLQVLRMIDLLESDSRCPRASMATRVARLESAIPHAGSGTQS